MDWSIIHRLQLSLLHASFVSVASPHNHDKLLRMAIDGKWMRKKRSVFSKLRACSYHSVSSLFGSWRVMQHLVQWDRGGCPQRLKLGNLRLSALFWCRACVHVCVCVCACVCMCVTTTTTVNFLAPAQWYHFLRRWSPNCTSLMPKLTRSVLSDKIIEFIEEQNVCWTVRHTVSFQRWEKDVMRQTSWNKEHWSRLRLVIPLIQRNGVTQQFSLKFVVTTHCMTGLSLAETKLKTGV